MAAKSAPAIAAVRIMNVCEVLMWM
jgi:hypothetical protein